MASDQRRSTLFAALAERILVLDGATGTWLQSRDLRAEDFGGVALDGCNEALNLTRPDLIAQLHRTYLDAGADLIETNSFGGTAVVLAEYGLAERALEINQAAAAIARAEADRCWAAGRPVWVAGSMGPTTKVLSVTGGITFTELRRAYRDQARGLLAGGVDLLVVETAQDTCNVKAALLGIHDACRDAASHSDAAGQPPGEPHSPPPPIPVILSCTIESTGSMLGGQGAEAFYTSIAHWRPLAVGLNCGTGPAVMRDPLRSLAALATTYVACVPNAGLPDADGCYDESPAAFAATLGDYAERGWVNLVGGCCGTTPEHIRALAARVRGCAPRTPVAHRRALISGIDWVEASAENRPILVGERSNVIGSRRFKRLIEVERFADAAEIARAQTRAGAQVVDICLANPDRDEALDMEALMAQAARIVRAPFMIDSSDPRTIEKALIHCQGKAIINSVNLEDSAGRLREIVALAHRYGAALVVGTIDSIGMGVSVERKLKIARRAFRLLTTECAIEAENIIWDPLTFPCGTGDSEYHGSAAATIEALARLHQEFPHSKTLLGISNVSFGLPAAGREVLNSVFLYHATRTGLDYAIVNTQRLRRHATISAAEVELAEDLLWSRRPDAIGRFVAHFRDPSRVPVGDPATAGVQLSLDDRLAAKVVEGVRQGVTSLLDRKLRDAAPLEIINGPLMRGMAEVGRLFNANRLIVAEVLQSAEVMKSAVAHLEPHMSHTETQPRGSILLATVKGDVHDIGKNLVQIILANNGYRVIDLGIKIPPPALIEAVRAHAPDVIGLSGLLVRSAQQMVATAQDLAAAGIELPILVGGAALSERFVRERIAPTYPGPVLYARDAMSGLRHMESLCESSATAKAPRSKQHSPPSGAPVVAGTQAPGVSAPRLRSTPAPRSLAAADLPRPPDHDRHVETALPVRELLSWINPQMLYGRHLGVQGKVRKLFAADDAQLLQLQERVARIVRDHPFAVAAVWRFFPACGARDSILLYSPSASATELPNTAPIAELRLPRQPGAAGRCLADYLHPDPGRDHLALFVATAGTGVRAAAARLRSRGEFLDSHILQALALELAEAAAEWLHARLRAAWGFPDPPSLTMAERFRAHYRGKRYSFGYAACPDLAHQRLLFDLLQPEEIGVTLTEDFMMEPEASVSALLLHHPDAAYFSVGSKEI
jgi:5-methyltetrahydrofolate--homocysteine methyltransferase